MARPTKLKPPEAPTPSSINDWIVRLIDKGEIAEELFDLACKLAQKSIDLKPERASSATKFKYSHNSLNNFSQKVMDEAREMACDFLIFHLKSNNLRLIFTKSELKCELSRYLTRRNNPEYHELWELLSDAIHELAKTGRAHRLDAPHTDINSNSALWVAKGINIEARLDLIDFYLKAKKIGGFYPQREEGRIIPPAKAVELAEKLLILAEAPIPFQELVNEARNHVVLSMQFPTAIAEEASDDDEQSQGGHYLTAEQDNEIILWISEEASPRAATIWKKIMRQNNGRILCLYILPKHFLGQRTTLSQFGSPQRVGEQSKDILQILAESLKLDRLPSDGRLNENDTFAKALLYLASKVSELLSGKCSENGWPVSLSIPKEIRGVKKESK